MYESATTSNFNHSSKSNSHMYDAFRSGFTPSHHNSYLMNGQLPSQSPFLSKMTKKAKNSRNDNLLLAHTGSSKGESVPTMLNVPKTQKVSICGVICLP